MHLIFRLKSPGANGKFSKALVGFSLPFHTDAAPHEKSDSIAAPLFRRAAQLFCGRGFVPRRFQNQTRRGLVVVARASRGLAPYRARIGSADRTWEHVGSAK